LKIVATVSTLGSPEHHVVVVGGGFGGLRAVSKLRRAPVKVTLVDRRNFHLFQPLTYQVATGALSPGEIAYPLRAIFKRDRNVRVLLAEVADFDLDARECTSAPSGRCQRRNGSATTR
jgi:NADH:quinone reductase (non-electrogenic)